MIDLTSIRSLKNLWNFGQVTPETTAAHLCTREPALREKWPPNLYSLRWHSET